MANWSCLDWQSLPELTFCCEECSFELQEAAPHQPLFESDEFIFSHGSQTYYKKQKMIAFIPYLFDILENSSIFVPGFKTEKDFMIMAN